MKQLFLTVLACAGICGTAAAQRAPAPVGGAGQPIAIDSGIKWSPDMWRAAFMGFVNTDKGAAKDLQLQRPVVGGASPYADWQDSAAGLNMGRVRVQNSAGQFQIGVVDDQGNNFTPWLTCTRSGIAVTGCSVGGGLQAGGLVFSGPLSGASLGTGSVVNLAPNQVVQGSLKVTGSNTPKFLFQSLLAPNQAQIYESGIGDLVFDTGDTDRSHIFYGNADFLGWLKNPGMALANPGSGAHFVCINDTGVLYRSDSACK